MSLHVSRDELIAQGLAPDTAAEVAEYLAALDSEIPAAELWQAIVRDVLEPAQPPAVHAFLHAAVFCDWAAAAGPAPAWFPSGESIAATNTAWLMVESGNDTYEQLYDWSIRERAAFWQTMMMRLAIRFRTPYEAILDSGNGPEHPCWLAGARLNIVDSCFQGPAESAAVIYQVEDGALQRLSVAELQALTWRVANGLAALGLEAGDRVAVDMPMTMESVAIYLGVIAAGCVVVSIADSFVPDEIRVRLDITEPGCIFTQDVIVRGDKRLPLYEKVCAAAGPRAIVVPVESAGPLALREGDIEWDDFLGEDTPFDPLRRAPGDHINILFSSGTTGEPKAIPWDHTTAIKSAVDGHLHHDARPGDILCWPTNLGWMMGPWLVFAALVNRATMALYYGVPTGREFGCFVQGAGVTMLGLVPSIVKAWKSSNCMVGLDFTRIRCFSSTGECSNAGDMLFLMALAGYRPIVEYCGGTEIGGGYITGTVVRPVAPGTFSTPALGTELVILDDGGRPTDNGEIFIIPPSMGLSQTLLNRDHHDVYYAGTTSGPSGELRRRHGDQIERLANGYFRAHGRVDDTMNLGGIKVSSAQLEAAVRNVDGVTETAAIGVSSPGGGPSELVVYTVLDDNCAVSADALKPTMQAAIREKLNPLFKVRDVVVIDALPRTASNKVMRRLLRAEYEDKVQSQP